MLKASTHRSSPTSIASVNPSHCHSSLVYPHHEKLLVDAFLNSSRRRMGEDERDFCHFTLFPTSPLDQYQINHRLKFQAVTVDIAKTFHSVLVPRSRTTSLLTRQRSHSSSPSSFSSESVCSARTKTNLQSRIKIKEREVETRKTT